MANTRKIDSAEMLDKHIKDFTEWCTKNGEIPSDYNLCKFLSVSASTLDRYKAGEGTYKGYDEPLKTLKKFREHRLLTMLEGNPKLSAAAIFQLKQPFNGGYQESQAIDQSATITLKIEGVGGVEAFK